MLLYWPCVLLLIEITLPLEPVNCTVSLRYAPFQMACAFPLYSRRSALEAMGKLKLLLPTAKCRTWSEPTAAVVTPVNFTWVVLLPLSRWPTLVALKLPSLLAVTSTLTCVPTSGRLLFQSFRSVEPLVVNERAPPLGMVTTRLLLPTLCTEPSNLIEPGSLAVGV